MNKKIVSLLVCISLIAVTILQVLGNPIGFALGNDTGKTRDVTSPTITINFAGNLHESGGPYWQPPGESTRLTSIFSNGYYINDSKQYEDWIYINLTVTDDSNVDIVWLNWLNETSWTNWKYQFTNTQGDFWEYNTSGNIKTFEGYKYSFNIVANDSSGNTNVVWWSKTGLGGDSTRRYVQLNCTTADISYTPYYLYRATYGEEDLYYIAGSQFTYDRLHHDQGPGATLTDCGFLYDDIPTDTVEERHSTHYVDFWFDETICAESFNLNNIYCHVWWSSDNENLSEVGWHKNRDDADGIFTDSYSTDISFNRSYSTIYYDNGDDDYNHNYALETRLLKTMPTAFTDNDIYELSVKLEAAPGFFDWHYPSVISNRSFTSFVLFNVPDNDTLNASYVDSDSEGLSDWTELYKTYTNPFLADTDNDGVSDYDEYLSGSDPNNWSDTIAPNNSPYVPSNPNPEDDITDVSINADLSWTGGDPDPGDTVTYDVFFGTSNPPPQVTWNQPDTTYNPGTLNYEQTYYWKIIAWDNHGEHTEGPVWDFTTEEELNNPPYTPSNPNPYDEETDVTVNADLSWTGGAPDPEDTVTYDVYFGTISPPPKVVSNQSNTIFDPELNYNTTYYWKIISWDNHGNYAEGSIWSFTTVDAGINQPPSVPMLIGPTVGGVGIEFNFSAVSMDPEGDQIYYNFSWGEGNYTGWLGPFNSSENVTTNYSWNNLGEYGLKVKAKDTYDMESDWSEIHTMTISKLIEISNLKLGFIYFRLHIFERESYIYLNLLEQLGFSVVIGTEVFEINTTASSDNIDSVKFTIFDQIWEENITEEDNNASDGFSAQLELISGIYEIIVSAYDSDGNLVDRQNISYVINICLEESSTETLRPISRMRERFQRIKERRALIHSSILKT